jgi:hypothetical protein
MKKKKFRRFLTFILIFAWFFAGWPVIWKNPRIPPKVQEIQALNKVNNWNFATDATGWSSTNDDGTDLCGSNSSSTGDTAMATLAYTGSIGNAAGSFQAVSGTSKNANHRGMVHQTIVASGSGTVKVKGMMDYYGNSASWAATNTSWIRLDIFDSGNSTFVANLACASFNSNQAWTTFNFSSDVDLTGGTTYTIRATLRSRTPSSNGVAVTLAVDNIIVNFAPTGLSASAPAGTTNAQLNWTASTAGSGANGLHATTPYKVYRDGASPVSTFLTNTATNSYIDSSTVGNTTYYYAISDVDTASVESHKSAEVSVLTLPAAPGTPTCSNVQSTTLRVGWTAPVGGADSYKVERCSGASCSDFSQITSGETNLYYDDSGLTAETLYRYKIRATNGSGDSAYSGIGEQTTGIEPIYSVAVTPEGTIEYGFVGKGENKSTIQADGTKTAANDGNTTAKFNIKTSNAIGGTEWTIGSAAGANIFVHEFSTNAGGNWTKFADAINYQTLAETVGVGNTVNFDLRVTVPTDSDTEQKTITVTVQAAAAP